MIKLIINHLSLMVESLLEAGVCLELLNTDCCDFELNSEKPAGLAL